MQNSTVSLTITLTIFVHCITWRQEFFNFFNLCVLSKLPYFASTALRRSTQSSDLKEGMNKPYGLFVINGFSGYALWTHTNCPCGAKVAALISNLCPSNLAWRSKSGQFHRRPTQSTPAVSRRLPF